jgi:hypothetical protein
MKLIEVWLADWTTIDSLTLVERASVVVLKQGNALDPHLAHLEQSIQSQRERFGLHVNSDDASAWWATVQGPLYFSPEVFVPIKGLKRALCLPDDYEIFGPDQVWTPAMRSASRCAMLTDMDWWGTIYGHAHRDARPLLTAVEEWLEQWPHGCMCWNQSE